MRAKNYPTDVTGEQWQLIAPLLPKPKPGGRPRSVDLREILNGVLYVVPGGVPRRDAHSGALSVLGGGAPGRSLPPALPPGGAVHSFSGGGRPDGPGAKNGGGVRPRLRHADGRRKSPSAAVVDTQTVRTASG